MDEHIQVTRVGNSATCSFSLKIKKKRKKNVISRDNS